MRVAIIGCGNISKIHIWALQRTEGVQIAALADCDIEKAERMSEKITDSKVPVYSDYLLMLEQIKPDVVHICTPHFLHVPMAVEALKHNAAVFMEKPPAVSKEEFEQLKRTAECCQKRIGFCFQNRYNASTAEFDCLLKDRELGEITGARGFVTWKREAGYYSDDWHGKISKEGGGVLINQSIHTLDLILRYLGEPLKIEASMQNHHLKGITETEDTLEAWMEFEGNKRASFYATTAYADDAPVILELTFEKGRAIMIDNMIQIFPKDSEPKIKKCEEQEEGIGKGYWGKGHLACIRDFYHCLDTSKRYENDLAGVENTLNTTMRIYESALKNGGRI